MDTRVLARLGCGLGMALALAACDAPQPDAPPADAATGSSTEAVAGAETAPPGTTAPAELDERAIAIVRRAADFLRDQPRIAVTVRTEYDTLQPSGEQLEFGASRKILIQRPDKLRVETQPRDKGPRITVFDGRLLSVLDVENNAWAQVEREGDIDSTLDFIQDDLATPMPLSELWRADPSRDFVSELREAYVAGIVNLDGVRCDHVFLRNDRVDGQLFIEQGETPRFHRIALTYRNEEGQPSLRAHYSDWDFAPGAGGDAFQFTPPPDADRIVFAARPRAAATEEVQ
jgi:hypothetical protein